MPADVYVQDGVVYPDEATAVVAMHPNIPEELKRIYIPRSDEKPNTKDNNVYEPPATLDQNVLTPRGLEGNRQFQQDPELETPIRYTYPIPDYLNPPEQGPGFEGSPRPEPKVLFKTTSPLVNITDQDIDTAIGITTSFGSGTIAGVKAAKNLGKINDLGQATIMEHQGVHPDKILSDTGWHRGVDNRWKFELDDSKVKFNSDWVKNSELTNVIGGGKVKLPDVIDHPELYKAYPELKDVNVVKDPRVETAHWDEANNEIVVGSEQYNTMGTFLHEIQHAVQTQEGFARGAAWGKAGRDYTLKYAKAAHEQIVEPLRALYKKLTSPRGAVASDADLAELDRLQMMARKFNEYAKAGDADAMERYMNTAGEVEARNAEARMMLNAAERRSMHPTYTADRDAPTVNFTPGIQTPYGFKPYGKAEAPPTQFRRAANDNPTPAMQEEARKLRKAIRREESDKAFAELLKLQREMDERITKRPTQERGNQIREERVKLREILETRDWTELEEAKYNKLEKELFPK